MVISLNSSRLLPMKFIARNDRMRKLCGMIRVMEGEYSLYRLGIPLSYVLDAIVFSCTTMILNVYVIEFCEFFRSSSPMR
jgi:hypothetical protein